MEDSEKIALKKEASTVDKELEVLPLKKVLEEIDYSKDETPVMVMPMSQVLIIIYDPLTRNVSVKHVRRVSGLYECLNVLRDTAYQLEQMELVRKVLNTVGGVIQNECAKLFAKLSGNQRQ